MFFLFNGELTGKLFVRGYVQKNFQGLRPRTPDKLYTFFFNGGLIEYLICDDINHFLIPNVPGAPPRTPDRLIGCMYVFYTDGWLSSKFLIMLLAWVNQNFLVASHPDPRQIISLFFFNGGWYNSKFSIIVITTRCAQSSKADGKGEKENFKDCGQGWRKRNKAKISRNLNFVVIVWFHAHLVVSVWILINFFNYIFSRFLWSIDLSYLHLNIFSGPRPLISIGLAHFTRWPVINEEGTHIFFNDFFWSVSRLHTKIFSRAPPPNPR